MRVEDLTKFEGECPNIVIFGTYMDIRVPLTKKWKKIINDPIMGILEENRTFISSRPGCILCRLDEMESWAYLDDLLP